MRRALLLMLVGCWLGSARADDDWLGLPEPPLRLAAAVGADQDGGQRFALDAAVPAGQVQIFLRLEQDELGDGQRSWRAALGVGTDPYADTVVRIDLDLHGQPEAAEFRELLFELAHYVGPWELRLQAVAGELELYYEDWAAAYLRRESVSTDRRGLGLGVGYQIGPLYLSADYLDYSYERDLSVLAERPLLQLLLRQEGLGEAAAVADWQAGLGLGGIHGDWDWRLGYRWSRSELDGARMDSAGVGAGYQFSAVHLGLLLDLPRDGDAAYAELRLGWRR